MSKRSLYRGTPAGCPSAGRLLIPCAEAMSVSPMDDGWSWPIQVIEEGWADGTLDGAPGTPQYISQEVVAQVAEACKSTRFGRRSPNNSVEECDPSRIAGMITDGRTEGGKAVAMLHLNPGEEGIRAQLVAAQKAGLLDLFGVSVCGLFEIEPRTIEGQLVMEVCGLNRLISVDFVVESGTGGKILPFAGFRAAASEYLPPQIAAAREAKVTQILANTLYLAAAQFSIATAQAIQHELRNETMKCAGGAL